MLIKNKLINIKSNLAQSLESNHIIDYVQLKLPDVHVFTYFWEHLIYSTRGLRATEKDDFVNILPKHKSATLWHYGGNTQGEYSSTIKEIEIKKKNQKTVGNTRIAHLSLKLSEDSTIIRDVSW